MLHLSESTILVTTGDSKSHEVDVTDDDVVTASGVPDPSRRRPAPGSGLRWWIVAGTVLLVGGLSVVGILWTPTTPTPRGACQGDGLCEARMPVRPGWSVLVVSNAPVVEVTDARYSSAVVVVPGFNRKARVGLAGMRRAAGAAGVDGHTLIVVPAFQTPKDGPDDDLARWKRTDWSSGGPAIAPEGLSSFEVMDQLLTMLADKQRFPRMARITVAGHSAGGQFAQRYAAVGRAPTWLTGVALDYVVANPSSYLELDPTRPRLAEPAGGPYFVPTSVDECPGYDRYKYGLNSPPPYFATTSPSDIVAHYLSQRVTYLAGENDREHGERAMLETCG